MALTLINTAAINKYVSPRDPGYSKKGSHKVDATVFHLGAMDSFIDAHIKSICIDYSLKEGISQSDLVDMSEEEAANATTFKVDTNLMAIETVKYCLKGWDNLKDHNGNDVEFKTKKTQVKGRMYDALDTDILSMLPAELIQELYVEINKGLTLTEEQAKNSDKG